MQVKLLIVTKHLYSRPYARAQADDVGDKNGFSNSSKLKNISFRIIAPSDFCSKRLMQCIVSTYADMTYFYHFDRRPTLLGREYMLYMRDIDS